MLVFPLDTDTALIFGVNTPEGHHILGIESCWKNRVSSHNKDE
jgi:hypothetical protein